MTIIKIITTLRSCNGSLELMEVLEKEKDNKEWLKFLEWVYDPNITYGVRSHSRVDGFFCNPDNGFYGLLDSLKTRGVKGDEKASVISYLDYHYGNLTTIVFNRSLGVKVDVKTLNKVYGKDFIEEFKTNKAFTYDGKLTEPMIVSTKFDGFNHTVEVIDGGVIYYTSGGKTFTLEDDGIFSNIPDGYYMCELIGTNGKLGDRVNCGIATTLRTRSSKGLKNHNIGSAKWKVFDYVEVNEYNAGRSTTEYKDRFHILRHIAKSNDLSINDKDIVATKQVDNHKDFSKLLKHVTANGWEGLVLKSPSHIWNNSGKRDRSFMKAKIPKEFDLEVIGVVEGKNEKEGMVGSLVLADATGREVGKVGSGLTYKLSKEAYNWVGDIVEVKCEKISKDGILIQPVFLYHRGEEKRKADIVPCKNCG